MQPSEFFCFFKSVYSNEKSVFFADYVAGQRERKFLIISLQSLLPVGRRALTPSGKAA